MTEPVIWNNGREAPNGFNWQWRCTGCGIDESSTYGSQAQAAYAVKRHCLTNRHIRNTTPKTQPETAQEAQETEFYGVTLEWLSGDQLADLCVVMAKWIREMREEE